MAGEAVISFREFQPRYNTAIAFPKRYSGSVSQRSLSAPIAATRSIIPSANETFFGVAPAAVRPLLLMDP